MEPTGLINKMFVCHLQGDTDKKDALIVRIFGEQGLSDRHAELLGLQIAHAAGCGAPLVAIFDNGLVFGFVKGRSLVYEDYEKEEVMR